LYNSIVCIVQLTVMNCGSPTYKPHDCDIIVVVIHQRCDLIINQREHNTNRIPCIHQASSESLFINPILKNEKSKFTAVHECAYNQQGKSRKTYCYYYYLLLLTIIILVICCYSCRSSIRAICFCMPYAAHRHCDERIPFHIPSR
jgi:hypothetical protein